MRKVLLILLCLGLSLNAMAQMPYFKAQTGLDSKVFISTSLSSSGSGLGTHSTVQYREGIIGMGLDFTSGAAGNYLGVTFRLIRDYSKYFNFSLKVTPSFNLKDKMKLKYTTINFYLNGAITKDEKLFWLSNTDWYSNNFWYGIFTQYTYLAYQIDLFNNFSLTPFVGETHSWRLDGPVDITTGLSIDYERFALTFTASRLIHTPATFCLCLNTRF